MWASLRDRFEYEPRGSSINTEVVRCDGAPTTRLCAQAKRLGLADRQLWLRLLRHNSIARLRAEQSRVSAVCGGNIVWFVAAITSKI